MAAPHMGTISVVLDPDTRAVLEALTSALDTLNTRPDVAQANWPESTQQHADDIEEGMQRDPDEPFEFVEDEHGAVTVSSAIFQALGAASKAWDEGGRFQPERVTEIGRLLELLVTHETRRVAARRSAIIEQDRRRLAEIIDEANRVLREEWARAFPNVGIEFAGKSNTYGRMRDILGRAS